MFLFFFLFQEDETDVYQKFSGVCFLTQKCPERILELLTVEGRNFLHGKSASDPASPYELSGKCFLLFCLAAFNCNEPKPRMLLDL